MKDIKKYILRLKHNIQVLDKLIVYSNYAKEREYYSKILKEELIKLNEYKNLEKEKNCIVLKEVTVKE